LLDEVISRSVDETIRGLEWLVEKGFLIRTQTTGAGVLFRLGQEERARAQSFVARSERHEQD
jgi:hypothetical protein